MIAETVADGERCRCQEIHEFHRGEVEIRGINSRVEKRRMEVDIIEVKRRIGSEEGTTVDRMIEMGRPKDGAPRIDIERIDPKMPPGSALRR